MGILRVMENVVILSIIEKCCFCKGQLFTKTEIFRKLSVYFGEIPPRLLRKNTKNMSKNLRENSFFILLKLLKDFFLSLMESIGAFFGNLF